MKAIIKLLSFIAFSIFIIGCSDSRENTSDYGRLSVQLTDAPFPYDLVAEANVTIFKVDARYKGHANLDDLIEDGTEVSSDSLKGKPFIVLMEDELQANLLDLTNGITKTLVDIDVPVGSYDLIRVYVKGVHVVLTDGTTYDLDVPSGSQTGIKIFIHPEITVNGGLTSDLLLDFDVSKSFVVKGNPKDLSSINGFNFKPVIKASNMSTTGTLMGAITAVESETTVAVEGAQVAVYIDDTNSITTFSDVDGSYMIMGLDTGSYNMEVEKEGFMIQTAEEVNIIAGNKTAKNFELVQE